MRIAICTCPRSNDFEYVLATLHDMEVQDPTIRQHEVKVFVAASEASQLPSWVQVDLCPAKACLQVKVQAMHWISQVGLYGCLLEDDILFARNWFQRALNTAQRLDKFVPNSQWFLKLEHWAEMPEEILVEKTFPNRFAWLPPIKKMVKVSIPSTAHLGFIKWSGIQEIWGNQSLVMPARTARLCIERINKLLAARVVETNGYLLSIVMEMCREKPLGSDLYVSEPCLTKHVGEISCATPGRDLVGRFAVSFSETDRHPDLPEPSLTKAVLDLAAVQKEFGVLPSGTPPLRDDFYGPGKGWPDVMPGTAPRLHPAPVLAPAVPVMAAKIPSSQLLPTQAVAPKPVPVPEPAPEDSAWISKLGPEQGCELPPDMLAAKALVEVSEVPEKVSKTADFGKSLSGDAKAPPKGKKPMASASRKKIEKNSPKVTK
jgi:hypothetical protein